MAVERGAHVIRTHDVAETRDAALVGAEFARDRVRSDDGPSDIAVEELDVTTVREAERHLDRLDADQSVAGDAAVRTYELRGLTDEAVGALRAATAEPGVGAAFALAGSDAAETAVPLGHRRRGPTNGESGLLVGTVAALSAVRSAVSGVSDALDAALESIDDGSK